MRFRVEDFQRPNVLISEIKKNRDLIEGRRNGIGRHHRIGVILAPLAMLLPAESAADINSMRFVVPTGEASAALNFVSRRSKSPILYPNDLVEDIQVDGFECVCTVEEVVGRIIEGQNLTVSRTDFDVYVITTTATPAKIGVGNLKNSKKNALLAGAASVAIIGSGSASAQDQSDATAATQVADERVYDTVVVTGIRKSLQTARATKRNSQSIVDSIAPEDIGKLPDTNLAESLQRISGVSIDRSGGEGQFITVRGFGPEFNTVLVNGRQIASEDLSRAFAFDTIASELVSGIDVYKSPTANFQSGGIGSTVNIRTARPFDFDGFRLAGNVAATYEENSEEVTPKLSGLVSNVTEDGKFGVLASAAYSRRDTRLDDARTDGWLENVGIPQSEINGGAGFAGNIFSPRNFDNRVTFEERERIGGTLVLQYRPSEDIEVTLEGLYSKFDIKTDTTSFGHWFTAPNIEDATVDANGTVIDLYQEVGLATDFHSKKFDRLTETYSLSGNVEWQVSDALSMSFDGHYSNATRDPNNGGGDQLSLIGYANRVQFQSDNSVLPWVSLFDSASPSIYSGQQEIDGVAYDPAVTPAGVSNYLDTANSRAHVMLRRGFGVEDEVVQLKTDAVWEDGRATGLTSIKAGVQYSQQTKAIDRWDNERIGIHCAFCGYPDSPVIPADSQFVFDAGDDFLSGVSGSDRLFTQWLAHNGEAQFAFLEEVSGLNFDAERRGISYEVEESTISGYVQGEFSDDVAGMPFTAVAGVRLEGTDVSVNGTDEPITRLVILDQTELLAERSAAEPVSFGTDYMALLPNISFRLDVTDNITARLAASQTITRPTLSALSPVLNVTTTRQGGDLRAEGGNPGLEPFKSDNIDLSFEYYYGDADYVSIGLFQKDVSDFIVTGQLQETVFTNAGAVLTDPSTGTDTNAPDAADGDAVFTVARPINGENATVRGIEASIQHTFGETGFGFQLNGTLVDGDAELDPSDLSQIFALTGLSDSINAVGYYDKGPFEVRLAWSWRDEFLQSLSQLNGNGVTYVQAYDQLDLSASYDVSDGIEVYFEGLNLTDEYLIKRGRFENHFLFAQDSGRRFNIGARLNF